MTDENNPKMDTIMETIRGLDFDDVANTTQSGKPDATVLTEKCGFNVSAKERDAAWNVVKKETTEPSTSEEAILLAAKNCHEVNKAYCSTIGDDSQPSWDDAPDWQKESAIAGVKFHIDNPDADDAASHESWLAQKEADGWTHGEEKDEESKTHPCIVPFEELPEEQQRKDALFRETVGASLTNPGWEWTAPELHLPEEPADSEPEEESDVPKEWLTDADEEEPTPTTAMVETTTTEEIELHKSDFNSHGVWTDQGVNLAYMFTHQPTGTKYFQPIGEEGKKAVAERKLPVYPF